MDTKERVGIRIKELRTQKGISQEELAHLSGLYPSHLGQLERGEKSATIDSLDKVAIALGLDLNELFNFDSALERPENAVKEKINLYLVTMSEDEQEDILKMVKLMDRWRKK